MNITAIGSLLDLGETVINKIWPDPSKRAQEILKLKQLAQNENLAELDAHVKLLKAQLDVNSKEAQHNSVFVAGWRPFVGWVCGLGLLYVVIIDPLIRFLALFYGYSGDFPEINTDVTLQVLLGMLGISGMRSFDKKHKVETNVIGK